MRIKNLPIYLIAALFSCETPVEEHKAPDDLLSKNVIIPVIIDLQVLESHYHKLYGRPDAYKAAVDSASYFVFDKYGTTKEQFKDSYSYYAYDVNEIFLLYETTLDSLNVKVSQSGAIE